MQQPCVHHPGSVVGEQRSSHVFIHLALPPICLLREQHPGVLQAQDPAVPCPISLPF